MSYGYGQQGTSLSVPYMDVNHTLYDQFMDQLVNVNTEISRLVFEWTCMNYELWNLECMNYELKQQLNKQIFAARCIYDDSANGFNSAPNDDQSKTPNTETSDDYHSVAFVSSNKKHMEMIKWDKSAQQKERKTFWSIQNWKSRASLSKQERSRHKPKRYEKQWRQRYFYYACSAKALSSFCGGRLSQIQVFSGINRRRKRKRKKYIGEMDENENDGEDNLPSGSDGSQEGRLWDLKIEHT